MKKQSLILLKKSVTIALKKYNHLRNMVEDAETELNLPKFKKQYEGKFWKFENSSTPDSKWWYYSFCREVIDTRSAICDCFQSNPYNENEFKVNSKEFFHLFSVEISRKEYMNALIDFLSSCQLMRDNVNNYDL